MYSGLSLLRPMVSEQPVTQTWCRHDGRGAACNGARSNCTGAKALKMYRVYCNIAATRPSHAILGACWRSIAVRNRRVPTCGSLHCNTGSVFRAVDKCSAYAGPSVGEGCCASSAFISRNFAPGFTRQRGRLQGDSQMLIS